MVGTRLPENLVQELDAIGQVESTDRSTTVRRLLQHAIADWKKEYYAQQYGERKMGLALAAQEAGISIWEMADYLYQTKVPAQYDVQDLQDDMKLVESLILPEQKAR